MILHHYSRHRALQDILPSSGCINYKPDGALWLSDETATMSWSRWCRQQDFQLLSLLWRREIELHENDRVLHLTTQEDMEWFYKNFAVKAPWSSHLVFTEEKSNPIAWHLVEKVYDAVVISPYQWECRLDMVWYYGWDCASGAVLHPRAVKRVGPAKFQPQWIARHILHWVKNSIWYLRLKLRLE